MSYLSQMTETKLQLISLTVMNMENPRSWKEFHDVWRKNLEVVEYNTFTIYDQL